MRNIPDAVAQPDVPWSHLIPAPQWDVYSQVIHRAERRGIRFAFGGGLAFSHYANRWRNTKDLDLYVLPKDRHAMIQTVRDTGLVDYFDIHDYDRGWIFRSHDNHGIIVDIIWQMANYRAQVDDGWLTRGDLVRIHGFDVRLLPAEELLWSKLYILQRDRCDWGDLLNILNVRAAVLDWAHLLVRVGEDRRVLAALIEIFAWACPEKAQDLPPSLWDALGISRPHSEFTFSPEATQRHIRLLDSRDWFGPNQPTAQPTTLSPNPEFTL